MDSESSQSPTDASGRTDLEDQAQTHGTCGICIDDLIPNDINPINMDHEDGSSLVEGSSQYT